ncbi:transposase [Lederbergia lenta]|uniref:Transposase n=1 Tax=Lederbergia lenta TaxID=1467 RepID=A0A2X4WD84_LEDLE|nr:transposase [Lederbergia lenta]
MKGIQDFIEHKPRLKVNEENSAVDRPGKRKILGFSFTFHKEPKVRIAKESIRRLHKKIRASRKMSYTMDYRIEKLNQYLMGWCSYFALADTISTFKQLDSWIRRQLRMCLWKNWKKPKTKYTNLIKLGTPPSKAWEWANSHKGYWRISNSPILHRNLGNSYWSHRGLKSLQNRYETLRQIS